MRVLAKWETLDLQVPQVTYGEGCAVIWIDNYRLQWSNSFRISPRSTARYGKMGPPGPVGQQGAPRLPGHPGSKERDGQCSPGDRVRHQEDYSTKGPSVKGPQGVWDKDTTDKTWNQRPEDFKPESQSIATFSSIVLNKNPLYFASSLNTCGMWIIKLHQGLFFNALSFLNVSSLFYSLIFHLSHFSFVHFQTTVRSWQDSFCFL